MPPGTRCLAADRQDSVLDLAGYPGIDAVAEDVVKRPERVVDVEDAHVLQLDVGIPSFSMVSRPSAIWTAERSMPTKLGLGRRECHGDQVAAAGEAELEHAAAFWQWWGREADKVATSPDGRGGSRDRDGSGRGPRRRGCQTERRSSELCISRLDRSHDFNALNPFSFWSPGEIELTSITPPLSDQGKGMEQPLFLLCRDRCPVELGGHFNEVRRFQSLLALQGNQRPVPAAPSSRAAQFAPWRRGARQGGHPPGASRTT